MPETQLSFDCFIESIALCLIIIGYQVHSLSKTLVFFNTVSFDLQVQFHNISCFLQSASLDEKSPIVNWQLIYHYVQDYWLQPNEESVPLISVFICCS